MVLHHRYRSRARQLRRSCRCVPVRVVVSALRLCRVSHSGRDCRCRLALLLVPEARCRLHEAHGRRAALLRLERVSQSRLRRRRRRGQNVLRWRLGRLVARKRAVGVSQPDGIAHRPDDAHHPGRDPVHAVLLRQDVRERVCQLEGHLDSQRGLAARLVRRSPPRTRAPRGHHEADQEGRRGERRWCGCRRGPACSIRASDRALRPLRPPASDRRRSSRRSVPSLPHCRFPSPSSRALHSAGTGRSRCLP